MKKDWGWSTTEGTIEEQVFIEETKKMRRSNYPFKWQFYKYPHAKNDYSELVFPCHNLALKFYLLSRSIEIFKKVEYLQPSFQFLASHFRSMTLIFVLDTLKSYNPRT